MKTITSPSACPRRLTEEEIRDMLLYITKDDGVFPTTLPIDLCPTRRLCETMTHRLKTIEIHPDAIPELRDTLQQKYMTSKIEPGKSVGVICAQSIGEKQTQMTLNTFHAAGITVETVVTGVPRFLELLNASKEPKLSSTKMYFHPSGFQSHHRDTNKPGKALLLDFLHKNVLDLRFSDFYTDFHIEDTASTKTTHRDWWYPWFLKIYMTKKQRETCRSTIDDSSSFIRYTINHDRVFRCGISPHDIARRLSAKAPEITCLVSPTSIGEIHVYYPTQLPPSPVRDDVVVDDENGDDHSEHHTHPAHEPVTTAGSSSPHEWSCLQHDLVVIHRLQNILLFGIPGIKDFYIEDGPSSDNDHPSSPWIVHTKGNNFLKLMAIPHLDRTLTVSNNMWNIYHNMGIEATREFLVQEFSSIIASDGAYINPCHVTLLVDIMTFSGTIVSISRYGMKNDQFGALAKASFEESLDNFLKAAFFSEKERTTDISASIICGKRSNIGTGLCDLHLDLSKML